MDLKQRITNYLNQKHMMQVATVSGDQPWCCTVYYTADKELNLYWASLPTRRHSQEIAKHGKVAIAVPVKHINGEKVVGLQAEGTAEAINNTDLIKPAAISYGQKFGRDAKWIEDFTNLKTDHKLYKFTPKLFVLFDEENYPDNPRQELQI